MNTFAYILRLSIKKKENEHVFIVIVELVMKRD